ncbi:MAG: hypothetical protein ACSHWX_15050 [Maritalea sp.]
MNTLTNPKLEQSIREFRHAKRKLRNKMKQEQGRVEMRERVNAPRLALVPMPPTIVAPTIVALTIVALTIVALTTVQNKKQTRQTTAQRARVTVGGQFSPTGRKK